MSAAPPAFVLLNPHARQGTGPARFARVRAALDARFEPTLCEMDAAGAWRSELAACIESGVRVLVAAGGDGTVHALVNALVDARGPVPLSDFVLGAVGLGSSNDFHKPFRTAVAGIPLRIDLESATPRDLVRVVLEGHDGATTTRLVAISASLGLVAEGNAFFEKGDHLLRALKRRWTSTAIAYTAARSLHAHRDFRAVLRLPDAEFRGLVSSLSVTKTEFVSGAFRYDTPVAPDSGTFAVNLCEGMGRLALLWTMVGVARGKFLGRPGTRHWDASALDVQLEDLHEVELDGEIEWARRARFDVLPERIRTCG